MQAGASKPWQVILNETIGESTINVGGILEYFAPLYEFLKEYQTQLGYPIGWSDNAFEDMIIRSWE